MRMAWAGAVMVALVAVGVGRGQAATPALQTATVREALGVNIHFTDARPGEMKMLGEAGLGWVRMDLGWGGTERERGVYDFSRYDRLLKDLDEQHMRALLILDYSNKLYDDGMSPHTDAGRAAFAKWAAAAAVHFRGRGVLWEIYNEPNIGFWKPKPNVDDYVKLAVAATDAIHAAAPGEMVIGPATSRVDLGFIGKCLDAGLGQKWAGISVHPYRQSNPETAAADYAKLRALMKEHGIGDRPIISGEWGYSAVWKNYDAVRQGNYMVRECLTNLAEGVPLSILYDWHDDGTDAKDPECHFGLVANTYHAGREPAYDAKPGYVGVRTLTEQIGAMHFVERVDLDFSDDYMLSFSDGKRQTLVAWTTGKPDRLLVTVAKGTWQVVRWDGSDGGTLKAEDGPVYLDLTNEPQYLHR